VVDLKREMQTHSDIFLILLAYFGMLTAKDPGMNCITQSGPGVGCDDHGFRSIASDSLGTGRTGGDSALESGDLSVPWRTLMDAVVGMMPGQDDQGKRAMDWIESDGPTDLPIQDEDGTTSSNLADELSVRCAPKLSDTQHRSLDRLSSRHANGLVRLSQVIGSSVPGLADNARSKSSQSHGSPEGHLPRKGNAETESTPALNRDLGAASSDDVNSFLPGAVPMQGWWPPPNCAQKREPKIVDGLMRDDSSEAAVSRRAKIEVLDSDQLAAATECGAGQKKPPEAAAVKSGDADLAHVKISGNPANGPAQNLVERPARELSSRRPVDSQTAISSAHSMDEERQMELPGIPKSHPQNSTARADEAAFSASAIHRRQRAASDGAAIGVPEAASENPFVQTSSHGTIYGDASTPPAHLFSRPPEELRNERPVALAPDGSSDGPKAHWIHTGSHRAEAGFEDPSFGWIGVRAERDSGGLRAVLVPSSNDAEEALNAHLSGLNAHLANNHIQMPPVTVSSAHDRSFDSSFDANAQHGSDRQRGNADKPAAQERLARGESGGNGSHDSDRNLTFFAMGNRASGGSYVSLVA
jgi:hypothetical protein